MLALHSGVKRVSKVRSDPFTEYRKLADELKVRAVVGCKQVSKVAKNPTCKGDKPAKAGGKRNKGKA